jgi:hypothetical protein
MKSTESKGSMHAWALGLCEKWNWNANIAEIARDLIDADVSHDSVRFEVLKEVFNDFYNTPKMDCIEAVEQVLENFGD